MGKSAIVFAVCLSIVGALLAAGTGNAVVANSATTAPSDRRSEAGLNKIVRAVHWKKVPLYKAIDDLRRQTWVPLIIDSEKFKRAGIGETEPVTLDLEQQPLSVVLKRTFDAAIGEINTIHVSLDYEVANGVVWITANNPDVYVHRIYDVRDLLEIARRDVAAGQRLRTEMWELPYSTTAPSDMPEDELIYLIFRTVDSSSWLTSGSSSGFGGTMTIWNGRLIVRNSPDVQADVVRLLISLQKPAVIRSPQTSHDGPSWAPREGAR